MKKDVSSRAEAARVPAERRRKRIGVATDDPIPAAPGEDEGLDRQFIVALARGMDVLSAFRPKEGPLGNRELSQRTGIPAATVSRITYTLSQLGFLEFDARQENYELGGSTLALGQIALVRRDIRRIASPLMQELADSANGNVGLGVRDRNMMIYIETCEGSGLVGLRLFNGSRIPMISTAMGRAYLARMTDDDRSAVLAAIRPQFGADWSTMVRRLDQSMRDMDRYGFCMSLAEWQPYINGAGTTIQMPNGALYGMNIGGPAYILTEDELLNVQGPKLVEIARKIEQTMSAKKKAERQTSKP
jgi:DNA-binding IclR family transcriptional regulator